MTTGGERPEARLRQILRSIDGAPFARYREILGRFTVGAFGVAVDAVPHGRRPAPAHVRIGLRCDRAGIGDEAPPRGAYRVGAEDWLARRAAAALDRLGGVRADRVPARLQEIGAAVLDRSACRWSTTGLELRWLVDLPCAGQRIRGRDAERLLLVELPRLATASLTLSQRGRNDLRDAGRSAEEHRALQAQLRGRGLVAFLAEGSVLAREGGAAPLEVPAALSVSLDLPHGGVVRGLGIPAGVTVVIGGAFHGKSTLLDAVAQGVHPHPAGDGRERVVTVEECMSTPADPGRALLGVDVSPFLADLPAGQRSAHLVVERASGAVSQAAAILEAVEWGARLVLVDEDRSATGFLVRDGRMQRLVPRGSDPLVPLVDRVRELYDRHGVSTILATGGIGDYLEAADTVIWMEDQRPRDATREAERVVVETRATRLHETVPPWRVAAPQLLRPAPGFDPTRGPCDLHGPRTVQAGEELIELAELDQIVEAGQLRTVAAFLRSAGERLRGGALVGDLVDDLAARIERDGLDSLDAPAAYDLSRPRTYELAAALHRWRALRFVERAREPR